jgi:hypothetical protein
VQQFAAEGLNFGYSYEASPIISYDAEPAPTFTMGDYTPSTVPGCRAPHFWTAAGRSVYDELGLYYSAIVRDDVAPEDLDSLVREAAVQRLPLKIVPASRDELPDAYSRRVTVVRQDQHVAWRGDEIPRDVGGLVGHLRGARPEWRDAEARTHEPRTAAARPLP